MNIPWNFSTTDIIRSYIKYPLQRGVHYKEVRVLREFYHNNLRSEVSKELQVVY